MISFILGPQSKRDVTMLFIKFIHWHKKEMIMFIFVPWLKVLDDMA